MRQRTLALRSFRYSNRIYTLYELQARPYTHRQDCNRFGSDFEPIRASASSPSTMVQKHDGLSLDRCSTYSHRIPATNDPGPETCVSDDNTLDGK